MGFSEPREGKTEEEQLVKNLQAGEVDSFEQLANLYQKKIYALSFIYVALRVMRYTQLENADLP